jgi:hypothetical protein
MKRSAYLIFIMASLTMQINSCKKNNGGNTSNMATQLKNGLIAWYPFTGNAMDSSGNGNNGTVKGATLTTDRFGKPDCAHNFDGSNFTPIIQKNISAWSISLWFKTTLGGGLVRGSRDCGGGVGTRLDIRGDGQYKIVYGADDYRYVEGATTTNAYNDNQWHHVAGVWNGTGKVLRL